MKVPYIGITGFTSPDQVRTMRNVLRNMPSRHLLGVGVMMSRRTMCGLESKYTDVFPKNETVANIFVPEKDVFSKLHYADYFNESDTNDFERALTYAGPNVHAIQFDMIWPDPGSIKSVIYGATQPYSGIARKKFPVEVILQIGSKALAQVGNSPEQLVEKLSYYVGFGVVDRILLDKSAGNGVPMNADELLPFANAVAAAYPDIGIGGAGGLGPDTTHYALPFVQRHPNASLCAESRLRTSGKNTDPLEMDRCVRYLREVNTMFQSI